MRGLKDKRVLITGGASGIGAATAQRFLEEGSRVCVLDRDAQACGHIKHELPALGEAIIADVTDLMQVEAAFAEAIRLMDGVDVLINNAGISIRHKFLDITPEEWDKVLAVNLTGVFYVAQTAARHMISVLRRLQRDQGGSDRADAVDGAGTRAQGARVRGGSGIRAHAHATRGVFRRDARGSESEDSPRPSRKAGGDRRAVRVSGVGRRGVCHGSCVHDGRRRNRGRAGEPVMALSG
jgi:NAD(P)-dependent dehydrogenase (short-subunit alcohol dehydrogenase family)